MATGRQLPDDFQHIPVTRTIGVGAASGRDLRAGYSEHSVSKRQHHNQEGNICSQ